MNGDHYKPGELFVYTNGDSWELGVVKSQRDDFTYFCYYHTGDTAAATPVEHMHKLYNAFFAPIKYADCDGAHEPDMWQSHKTTVHDILKLMALYDYVYITDAVDARGLYYARVEHVPTHIRNLRVSSLHVHYDEYDDVVDPEIWIVV